MSRLPNEKRGSDEISASQPRRGQQQKSKGVKKDTCVSCSWHIETEEDGGSIACAAGHWLCGECSAVYADSVLASNAIPPKCCMCHGMVPPVAFEKLLGKEQMEKYLTLTAMQSLGEGEEIFSCVTCSYFEVRLDRPGFFFCRAGCAPHWYYSSYYPSYHPSYYSSCYPSYYSSYYSSYYPSYYG